MTMKEASRDVGIVKEDTNTDNNEVFLHDTSHESVEFTSDMEDPINKFRNLKFFIQDERNALSMDISAGGHINNNSKLQVVCQ